MINEPLKYRLQFIAFMIRNLVAMSALSLSQFNHMATAEKYRWLEHYGIYLQVSRIDGACKVALFSMFDFYVEVWLDIKTDKLVRPSGFINYKKLDPYLQQIDIGDLL